MRTTAEALGVCCAAVDEEASLNDVLDERREREGQEGAVKKASSAAMALVSVVAEEGMMTSGGGRSV